MSKSGKERTTDDGDGYRLPPFLGSESERREWLGGARADGGGDHHDEEDEEEYEEDLHSYARRELERIEKARKESRRKGPSDERPAAGAAALRHFVTRSMELLPSLQSHMYRYRLSKVSIPLTKLHSKLVPTFCGKNHATSIPGLCGIDSYKSPYRDITCRSKVLLEVTVATLQPLSLSLSLSNFLFLPKVPSSIESTLS